MSAPLTCYNKGCLQKYDEEENTDGCCVHHPGEPVFHDAYKGWSCCSKKRTTDFTEFLNIPGCTKGRHNPVKPPEEPKPQDIDLPEQKEEVRKPEQPMERPSQSLPMKRLPQNIGPSLKPLLEKLKGAGNVKKATFIEVGVVPMGTPCKNAGCKSTFQGDQTNSETCLFHNGCPIFHEGMKYWSCCQRKTSDFSNFLEQEGCSTGKHLWFKQKALEPSVSCRYDWHQTGSQVVLSIFSKVPIPEKSFVDLNPVRCKIHIVFGEDRAVFEKILILGGVVDVSQSVVDFLGSKVEIKMKKAEPVSWKRLSEEPGKGDQGSIREDLENVNLDDVEVLVDVSQRAQDFKKTVLFGKS